MSAGTRHPTPTQVENKLKWQVEAFERFADADGSISFVGLKDKLNGLGDATANLYADAGSLFGLNSEGRVQHPRFYGRPSLEAMSVLPFCSTDLLRFNLVIDDELYAQAVTELFVLPERGDDATPRYLPNDVRCWKDNHWQTMDGGLDIGNMYLGVNAQCRVQIENVCTDLTSAECLADRPKMKQTLQSWLASQQTPLDPPVSCKSDPADWYNGGACLLDDLSEEQASQDRGAGIDCSSNARRTRATHENVNLTGDDYRYPDEWSFRFKASWPYCGTVATFYPVGQEKFGVHLEISFEVQFHTPMSYALKMGYWHPPTFTVNPAVVGPGGDRIWNLGDDGLCSGAVDAQSCAALLADDRMCHDQCVTTMNANADEWSQFNMNHVYQLLQGPAAAPLLPEDRRMTALRALRMSQYLWQCYSHKEGVEEQFYWIGDRAQTVWSELGHERIRGGTLYSYGIQPGSEVDALQTRPFDCLTNVVAGRMTRCVLERAWNNNLDRDKQFHTPETSVDLDAVHGYLSRVVPGSLGFGYRDFGLRTWHGFGGFDNYYEWARGVVSSWNAPKWDDEQQRWQLQERHLFENCAPTPTPLPPTHPPGAFLLPACLHSADTGASIDRRLLV